MILHIEAGHRRDASGDLIDCYILTDEDGQHIAATTGATIVDWGRADAIADAVNMRAKVREALTAGDAMIAALPKLDQEATEAANAATAAIAEALNSMGGNV